MKNYNPRHSHGEHLRRRGYQGRAPLLEMYRQLRTVLDLDRRGARLEMRREIHRRTQGSRRICPASSLQGK